MFYVNCDGIITSKVNVGPAVFYCVGQYLLKVRNIFRVMQPWPD